MTDLSPAAQAVLTALTQQEYGLDPADIPNEAGRMACVAAAALRAVADEVVPEHANPVGDAHDDARRDQWMRIRRKLLAFAVELEDAQ
jgi:hypothetical protein